MHCGLRLAIIACALVFLVLEPSRAEQVQVPRLDDPRHDVQSIPGWLSVADKPRSGKAGVIYLHGCDGIGPTENVANIQSWAEWYNRQGVSFLSLDSHGARNVGEACNPFPYDIFLQRPLDAYAGREYLIQNGYADPDKVFVHGLSQGATSVLEALRMQPPGKQGFAGGIAFYPFCMTGRYHPYAPAIILVGDRDEWTPASRCQTLIRRNPGREPGITLVVYPGAAHAFDFTFPVTTNSRGYTVGFDADAFNDSRQRVGSFIERVLGE